MELFSLDGDRRVPERPMIFFLRRRTRTDLFPLGCWKLRERKGEKMGKKLLGLIEVKPSLFAIRKGFDEVACLRIDFIESPRSVARSLGLEPFVPSDRFEIDLTLRDSDLFEKEVIGCDLTNE
jgi:hypothetical protein